MKILVVEPLEPLALSGTPITGSQYFSYAKVYPIPLPTTIIGALGAALGIRIESAKDSMDALSKLVEQLAERCKCSKPILVGPIIKFRELPQLYISIGNTFIPIDTDKGVKVLHASNTEYYVNLDACRYAPCIQLEPEIRIGIALKRRGGSGDKRVIMGYTYRYGVVEYRTYDGKPVTPLFIYKLNCEDIELKETIIRVGGEHRIAKMSTDSDSRYREVLEKIYTPLDLREAGIYIAINYVPLIPKSDSVLELDPTKLIGLDFVSKAEDIIGIIPLKGQIPTVRVERLGLGYSEVVKARRPQILALPPGTIFRVSSIRQSSVSKSVSKIVETLWSIGFASLFLSCE